VRLGRHIVEAREWLEQRLRVKFMTQTWEFLIDTFPFGDAEIELPFGPVQSIVSLKYFDPAGSPVFVDPATYYLDNTSRDSWLFTNSSWPSPIMIGANAVVVQFVAGYATAADVPASLKAAITLKVKELYDEINSDAAISNLLTNYMRMVA
jgi:uncharacterized phiE125 gp8 family phage protein